MQNPDTNELALHAVYIVDRQGTVIYRKVARRRPVSAELIDAIDGHRGDYPRADRKTGRPPRRVAYPSNDFQTLIEMAAAAELPAAVTIDTLDPVLAGIRRGASSDDTLIAYRAFIAGAREVSQDDLLQTAAWLARQRFIADKPAAITAGLDLAKRLRRVADLEAQVDAVPEGSPTPDELLHTLAAARGGLVRARATVTNNARAWNLQYAQGSLRGFREVAQER